MSTNLTTPKAANVALTRPADTLTRRPGEGDDEFISKKELAARLMVATRTIERWQHDDLLPYFKVGTVILFNWPEVVERLKTNFKVGGTKPEGLIHRTNGTKATNEFTR